MTNSKTMKHKINVIQLDKTKTMKKTMKNKRITFHESDYLSGDGMLTSVWGPSMWHYLHTMSFNYPISPSLQDKKHYRDFVLNLQHVLPCKYCRINLKTNFKKFPLTHLYMKNRESFSRYIYNLHEMINKLLNKTSNLTYDEVRERYEHFRARCTEEKPTLLKFIKNTNNNKTRKNREKGCTEPLYGKKSKCIIKIVPQEAKMETFQMDKKCEKVRMRGDPGRVANPASLLVRY